MRMSEMFPGKWLKKEDVPTPVVGTITRVTREEVNADNGGKELKVVMAFAESNLKPMILNIGNATAVTEMYGDDSANWIGKRVEIYTDPNVMFGGKRIGGLRLRAPSSQGAAPVQPAPAPVPAAPLAGPAALWDIKDADGNVLYKQTGETVFRMIAAGANPDLMMLKPSDRGREAVKPATEYGFVAKPSALATDESIPW
jgi:hypothetical protein